MTVRARASVLGQVATLGLVALSWAAVEQAAGSADLRRFAIGGWIALVVGATIGTVTPASRPLRRVSSFVPALALVGGAGFLVSSGGTPVASIAYPTCLAVALVLGLDLCWVARLRVWVFLSGIIVIPALVVPGRGQVLWAAAWLAGAFVTLWVLSADVHRSLARPVTDAPRRPVRRRPFDLGRILLVGLSLGVVFGMLADSPGYSYQPLERLVRYLPFRPPLDLAIDLDLDVRDYEVDDEGHEVSYRLTPEGQRFVLDPRTNEPFAVIERDGVDVFVGYDGAEVATVAEGASLLEVSAADGSATTTYDRDDRGWFIAVEGLAFRAELVDGIAVLTSPSGTQLVAVEGAVGIADVAGFEQLAAASGDRIQVPPAAVLDGTVGEGTRVWSYGDTIEVAGWRQGRRTYDIDEPGLEVQVRRRGDDMEYTWTADRSKLTVYVPDLDQAGTLRIDRTGNAFDYLEQLLAEQAADAERDASWTTWGAHIRRAVPVVVGVAVLAGAVFVLVRRRRRGHLPDPSWAEAMLARIERCGDRRTERRGPTESVVTYLGRLATEIDRDDHRLRDAAEVLDAALFGAAPLTVEERAQVDATVTALEDDGRSSMVRAHGPSVPPSRRTGSGSGSGPDSDDEGPDDEGPDIDLTRPEPALTPSELA